MYMHVLATFSYTRVARTFDLSTASLAFRSLFLSARPLSPTPIMEGNAQLSTASECHARESLQIVHGTSFSRASSAHGPGERRELRRGASSPLPLAGLVITDVSPTTHWHERYSAGMQPACDTLDRKPVTRMTFVV